ncbi:SLBB domain-containing protein [Gammaproteobacteria bacterium]|nr:SLBB domain-containing protein [Gammaproteobacteria bacterium]
MKITKVVSSLILVFITSQSFAQQINPSILSQLSPEQIEIAKNAYDSKNSSETQASDIPVINESLIENTSIKDPNLLKGKKYGYNFFSTTPTSISAIGDLPLPNDYKISLRDQITVILSGSKDAIFDLNVKLDGTILFPELGAISVAGMTLGDVKQLIMKLVEQSYIGVQVDVSVKNLSAKKITIVGAVNNPGTYIVNPFSTISSALAYSGGVSEIGTLRNIKLIRNNGAIFNFDLYKLLINGDRSDDITIEAGDVIVIGPAEQFITLNGEVKRPAIYEVMEKETLEDLVKFGLGFSQFANKTNINLRVLDIESSSIQGKNVSRIDTSLSNVLSAYINNYVNKNVASIKVSGAIKEPGFYSLKENEYLEDIIKKLEFIDVYPWLGVLEQFDDTNLLKTTLLFNLNDSDTFRSIKLLPNSKIYFADINTINFDETDSMTQGSILDETDSMRQGSILDETDSMRQGSIFDETDSMTQQLIKEYSLTIKHKKNSYLVPVYGNFDVKSFIDFLGLDMTDVDSTAFYVSPLDDVTLQNDYKNMNFTSNKYHSISFRSQVNTLVSVNISGAVEYPGDYILEAGSTIDDLYKLIGNFKAEAFMNGIVVQRQSIRDRQLKAIKTNQDNLKELLLNKSVQENNIDINTIIADSELIEPENLGRIAGNFSPQSLSAKNTLLRNGDSLIVPLKTNTISVIGQVLNPAAFDLAGTIGIRTAISNAGGYTDLANKRKVYVIKANGLVTSANRKIFSKNISLEPGDTIVVPAKFSSDNLLIDSLAPITQVISNLAFSAAALDNLSTN